MSNENIQAISNQVYSTLYTLPGLEIDIDSSKEVVSACEEFDWTVEFFNDASAENTKTIITTNFPSTTSIDISNVTYVWNDA